MPEGKEKVDSDVPEILEIAAAVPVVVVVIVVPVVPVVPVPEHIMSYLLVAHRVQVV
jgi:hypothetical protein